VIDMCVKMLNPQEDEYMIDTAAGSSGFPVHTIFHVWRQILADEGLQASHLFSLEDKPPRCSEYVEEKVFAIDFDEKAVRVARTLNLIAGDGQTNVLHLNTLDYELWDEITSQDEWDDVYNAGFKRLKRRRPKGSKDYREFQFDVLMANPPFAGDIKEPRMISRYDLAKKPDGKWQTKVGRDILFIERNLDFLKPGGRMAIVLPQGRFNNSSDKNIRDFIAERCRILAVVGLHGNTFKPHTGTKTSVLFVQKWNDDAKVGALCPRQDDYNIFFATMRKSGKDNSGEKMWRKISSSTSPPDDELSELMPPSPMQRVVGVEGDFLQDVHGHLVVDHDLYNHEGLTEDGIAEAFIEFAKKEKLSFFEPSPSVTPFDAVKYQRLMDGLEAVELNIKEALISNDKFRWDSDFFKKDYTAKLNLVINQPFRFLGKIAYITDGEHGTVETSENGYSKYYGARNVLGGILDDNSVEYISEEVHFRNRRSILKPNDILISCVGANIGCAAIVPDDIGIANIVRNVALLRSIDPAFSNFYILAYFFSKYGKDLYKRTSTGNAQPLVILDNIKSLPIPITSPSFQLSIDSLFEYAKKDLNDSKEIYQQAEDLLLSELGLQDWQPTEETVAVKSFAESFLSSGRFDAEYYQPKYDEIEKQIKSYAGGWKNIRSVLTQDIKNGTTPEGVIQEYLPDQPKFVRAEAFSQALEINQESLYSVENETFKKYKSISIVKNDVLVSMTGTIGNVAVYSIDHEAIINQNIVKLTCDKNIIDPCILALYIKSVGRSLLVRQQTGNVQPYVNIPNFQNLIVPVLAKEVQDSILNCLKISSNQRTRSKQLLEIAKTGVEREIETDEATATAWINQQLEALKVKLT